MFDSGGSELATAQIYEVDHKGNGPKGRPVDCMFNPYEYTVSKTNSYEERSGAGAESPVMDLKKAGAQTLKLSLVFDTYESGKDVSKETRRLWDFMKPRKTTETKPAAPYVAFEWGVFRFVSLITNMTQKFTLFDMRGTPVRAKVDITFTQHHDSPDYQNPTSGGGPIQQVVPVVGNERLDNIAANVYGDATKWRMIAEHNNIDDPFDLPVGQKLTIPELR